MRKHRMVKENSQDLYSLLRAGYKVVRRKDNGYVILVR